MKFIEILRKLGIFRSGAVSGTYKNYKDMPEELMQDGVYDKKKDLVGGADRPAKEAKPAGGLAWLFWLLIIVSIFIVIFLYLMIGFSIWFFISLIIWLFFIYQLYGYKKGGVAVGSIFIDLAVFIVISIVFLFIADSGTGNNAEDNKNVSGSADCQSLATEYDGKVLIISSPDNLKGTVGFKIDNSSCAYEITWHSLFQSPNIVKNAPEAQSPTSNYDYIADIVFAKEGSSPTDGNIDTVFTNKDKLPADPFNHRVPYDFYLTKEIVAGTDKAAVTETFHHVMQASGTFSQAVIDGVLGVKKIRIFSRAGGVSGEPVAEFSVQVSK